MPCRGKVRVSLMCGFYDRDVPNIHRNVFEKKKS